MFNKKIIHVNKNKNTFQIIFFFFFFYHIYKIKNKIKIADNAIINYAQSTWNAAHKNMKKKIAVVDWYIKTSSSRRVVLL